MTAPAAALLSPRRMAWSTLLDLPVGLRSQVIEIWPVPGLLGLRYAGPHPDDGAQPGSLAIIEVRNPGWLPVRSSDFPAPLGFTFPGRRVLAASISPEATNRNRAWPAREPAIHVRPQASQGTSSGDPVATRVQLAGDFELRPRDGYIITVVLTGATTAPGHPVRHEGTLANGKIITCQQP